MAVFLDQDGEKYLAYECKRLNVVNKGSRESLATKYVKDGVKRFVTEQYAEHLPTGAMLGYVMDGDISFAQSKVQAALDTNQEEVNMISRPTPADPIAIIRRFRTWHRKETVAHNIEIHYGLLPLTTLKNYKKGAE